MNLIDRNYRKVKSQERRFKINWDIGGWGLRKNSLNFQGFYSWQQGQISRNEYGFDRIKILQDFKSSIRIQMVSSRHVLALCLTCPWTLLFTRRHLFFPFGNMEVKFQKECWDSFYWSPLARLIFSTYSIENS